MLFQSDPLIEDAINGAHDLDFTTGAFEGFGDHVSKRRATVTALIKSDVGHSCEGWWVLHGHTSCLLTTDAKPRARDNRHDQSEA